MTRRETQLAESKSFPKGGDLNVNSSNEAVFVIDREGTPLLPTCPARARILLKKGKATVYSVIPFTIQLKRTIKHPVGEFKAGIDDGAKMVGIAVSNPKKEVVFAANVELRQDVSRKVKQRAMYRRNRRGRLRHRKARFLNRGKKSWISPSIRYKKDVILRVLDDLEKRLNITRAVIEQGQFDTSSLAAGRKLIGKEYSKKEYEGQTFRQKVLWRDKYTCQKCGGKDQLKAHHILFKSQGGTDRVENGLTLCLECHLSLHRGEWSYSKKSKRFVYPAHTQQGKTYIYTKLQERYDWLRISFGWLTAKRRRKLGLPKDHHFDAAAMTGCKKYRTRVYHVKPRRTKVWENNPTKKYEEINGFRHYDIVKAKHRTRRIVVGSISGLNQKYTMALRTVFSNNFVVSYSKSILLQRPSGLIYWW